MFKSLVCVLALAVTATAAHAESLQVKTADLNLSTEAGVKQLDRRIMSAARKLCHGNEPTTTGSRLETSESKECVKRVAAEAREKLAVLKARSSS